MLFQMGPSDLHQLPAEQMKPDNNVNSLLPRILTPCMAEFLCLQHVCPAFCNGDYLVHRPLNCQSHSFQAHEPALQVTLHGILR